MALTKSRLLEIRKELLDVDESGFPSTENCSKSEKELIQVCTLAIKGLASHGLVEALDKISGFTEPEDPMDDDSREFPTIEASISRVAITKFKKECGE